MKISAEKFFLEAEKIVNRLRSEQINNIKEAGQILSETVENNGVIHIFGSGHSKAFGMEMAHRAGGLAMVNKMSLDDLALLADNPIDYEKLRDPETERKPENGRNVLKLYDIKPEDAFIVCSNSGRNGAVVEVALEAKRNNHDVIGVTSLEHSRKTKSRHPEGKKLYEVVDLCIDNCGPYGDALINIEELEIDVCSISSISYGYIAQSLTAEIIKNLLNNNIKPPIFMSQNVDGADERNQKLKEKYEGRVIY